MHPVDQNNKQLTYAVVVPFSIAIFIVIAGVMLNTVDDFGITWDEPVYRHTQIQLSNWFGQLLNGPPSGTRSQLFEAESLHQSWIGGRYGKNFHPPVAAILNSLSYYLIYPWNENDMAARRMSSALQFALSASLIFVWMSRIYGFWIGFVAVSFFTLIPRVFGHANLAATDIPMLFFWVLTTLFFHLALQGKRFFQVALGITLGLGFLTKLPTLLVILPLVLWLMIYRGKTLLVLAARLQTLKTVLLLLVPLIAAVFQIHYLAQNMWTDVAHIPQEERWIYLAEVSLLNPENAPQLPVLFLFLPLTFWVIREINHFVRSQEHPEDRSAVSETLMAILAWSPATIIALNPGWWTNTLNRFAHYYLLCLKRETALPDIEIFYIGNKYIFSLPWHNGWFLIASTLPIIILLHAVAGAVYASRHAKKDSMAVFLLLNAVALPCIRMLNTPAHDGVRLMLPCFFYIAGLSALGFGWMTAFLTPFAHRFQQWYLDRWIQPVLALVWLCPLLWTTFNSHPHELSYYNSTTGGLRGAAQLGLEISYWYDAVTPAVISDLNQQLPLYSTVLPPRPVDVFYQLSQLGQLREDLKAESSTSSPDGSRYLMLLTHSAKSRPTERILHAMEPSMSPLRFQDIRLFSVYDEPAQLRAQAITLLCHVQWERMGDSLSSPVQPRVPNRIRQLIRNHPRLIIEVAEHLIQKPTSSLDQQANQYLNDLLKRRSNLPVLESLKRSHPRALIDAAKILGRDSEKIFQIIEYEGYLPENRIGGYLSFTPATVLVPQSESLQTNR